MGVAWAALTYYYYSVNAQKAVVRHKSPGTYDVACPGIGCVKPAIVVCVEHFRKAAQLEAAAEKGRSRLKVGTEKSLSMSGKNRSWCCQAHIRRSLVWFPSCSWEFCFLLWNDRFACFVRWGYAGSWSQSERTGRVLQGNLGPRARVGWKVPWSWGTWPSCCCL